MKNVLLSITYVIAAGLIVSSCNSKNPTGNVLNSDTAFYFPAEFEKHESVWMGWPTYENKAGWNVKDLHVQLWAAMAPHVFVDVAINPTDTSRGWDYNAQIAEINALMKQYNVDSSKIRLHAITHEDVWWRDMGPIFVINKKGEKAIVDFNFNGWGYEANNADYSVSEGAIDTVVARHLGINKIIKTNLISEGGNREFNGKGTLIVVEPVELHRNPNLSKQQIEDEFKRVLGVKKIIWLPWGRFDDDLTFKACLPSTNGKKDVYTVITTGGHIDEHVRFVNANTILYTQITDAEAKADPIAAENKRRFEENINILQNATDQDGNKFELVAMPSAPAIIETLKPGDGVYDYLAANDSMKLQNPIKEGQPIKVILAASYLNFLITNNVVLAQKFYVEGAPVEWKDLDEKATAILQQVFPDRKIVTFDPRAINIGGGGIHCNTQQMPAVE